MLTVLPYSKKSQIEMIETIVVVLIIIIILSIGLYFYYKFYYKGVEETGLRLSRQESDVLLAYITSMPEFQCSKRASKEECLDTVKLLIAKDLFNENKVYYNKIFGSKLIRVEQIYPDIRTEECSDNNYPNCGSYVIYAPVKKTENKEIISTPVSLYFPNSGEYKIGKLIIEAYL
jgi:type II secretory pathway pseudopilin PulG